MRTVRLAITGRVQGVGYRIWAERTAARFGVAGWVRNRADGSVELHASGSEEAVAALIAACRQGPRAAAVTNVAIEDAEHDGDIGFTAKPTQ